MDVKHSTGTGVSQVLGAKVTVTGQSVVWIAQSGYCSVTVTSLALKVNCLSAFAGVEYDYQRWFEVNANVGQQGQK
ncbi:MAG: hypothetical protein R3C14_25210 [Caldilineaceae bacterium]